MTGGGPAPLPAGCGRGVVIDGAPSDWVGRYEDVVLATVLALPLAALLAWALARRRRRAGHSPASAWHSALCEVGIAYGTIPGVWLTLLPGSGAGDRGQLSLVPLRDLAVMPAYQVVGNLLVFAALGLLAPLRFAAVASVPRTLALAAAGSLLIETAQYVLSLGRVSSVDDVLLNAAGAGLAALASRRWWRAPGGGPGRERPPVALAASSPGAAS